MSYSVIYSYTYFFLDLDHNNERCLIFDKTGYGKPQPGNRGEIKNLKNMKKLNFNLNAKLLSKDQMKSVKGGSLQTLICRHDGLNDYCGITGISVDCADSMKLYSVCGWECGYAYYPVTCGNES